jgi:hypothetical protein
MASASFREAFFQVSGVAFGDFLSDLLCQLLTPSARGKIPFHFLIPRRFSHRIKPAGELLAFLFRQMLDRFLDGVERHMLSPYHVDIEKIMERDGRGQGAVMLRDPT